MNLVLSSYKKLKGVFLIILLIPTVFSSFKALAQNPTPKEYFIVENYYKVKWGFAEEFISLWKTNHYPLLKKAIEKGDEETQGRDQSPGRNLPHG